MVRVIDKIVVAERRITIEINQHELRDLLVPAAEAQLVATIQTDQPHTIARAFQLKRCGNGKKLIIGQIKDDDRPRADPSLVKAIARAHVWFEDLKTGQSYKEIASRCGIDERLVARTIRLAFLAPDITKAILTGNEPSGLTSQKLIRISKLPADWNAQREVLGFI
tara:strand:- start:468 stop:965 length:498 start_codon:yes stop_codon:yes gene_type:complete